MAVAPMAPAPMGPVYNIAVAPVPVEPKMAMYGGATLSPPLAMPHLAMGHDMAALMPAQVVPQMGPHIVQVEHTSDTASLLQEFENVYDETVMTLGALTPPQSPPGAPVLHELKVASPRPSKAEMILPHSSDLTELDEIVNARAAETVFSSPMSEGPSSPVTSVSSCAPSLDEPALDEPSPSPSTESSDDPDWVPSPVAAPAALVARGRGRKRAANSKPYARATQEDKKLRKKEQNKNAATRYRLKKKMEVEVILEEEQGLQETNDKLKQRVSELSQEIRYLKDLMRDLCRAKGLIK